MMHHRMRYALESQAKHLHDYARALRDVEALKRIWSAEVERSGLDAELRADLVTVVDVGATLAPGLELTIDAEKVAESLGWELSRVRLALFAGSQAGLVEVTENTVHGGSWLRLGHGRPA